MSNACPILCSYLFSQGVSERWIKAVEMREVLMVADVKSKHLTLTRTTDDAALVLDYSKWSNFQLVDGYSTDIEGTIFNEVRVYQHLVSSPHSWIAGKDSRESRPIKVDSENEMRKYIHDLIGSEEEEQGDKP